MKKNLTSVHRYGIVCTHIISTANSLARHSHYFKTVAKILIATSNLKQKYAIEVVSFLWSSKTFFVKFFFSLILQAFGCLVKLAVKSENGSLDTILYHILKYKLCQSHKDQDKTKLSSTVSNDSITSGIESVMMSLHLGSSGESLTLPSHSDSSLTRLLVTASDTLITEKIDQIYSCLSASCIHNPRANRIFESSLETNLKRSYSRIQSSNKIGAPLKRTLKRLLKHCANCTSTTSACIASIIFQSSDSLIDYFDSELLSTVCDKLTSMDSSSCSNNEQLYVLCMLLSYLEHYKGRGETLKMSAKQLWRVCFDLLSSSGSIEVQVC